MHLWQLRRGEENEVKRESRPCGAVAAVIALAADLCCWRCSFTCLIPALSTVWLERCGDTKGLAAEEACVDEEIEGASDAVHIHGCSQNLTSAHLYSCQGLDEGGVIALLFPANCPNFGGFRVPWLPKPPTWDATLSGLPRSFGGTAF